MAEGERIVYQAGGEEMECWKQPHPANGITIIEPETISPESAGHILREIGADSIVPEDYDHTTSPTAGTPHPPERTAASGAVVRTAPTLYNVEDTLAALLNSIDLISEGDEPAYLQCLDEIAEQTALARQKRDNVVDYLDNLDDMQAYIGEKIDRLYAGKERIERHKKKLRAYLLDLVERFAPPPRKGLKMRSLAGNRHSLSLREGAETIEVFDEKLVPEKYKRVTVELSGEDFAILQKDYGNVGPGDGWKIAMVPDKKALKSAMASGEDIPGADRVFGLAVLVVK